MSSARLIVGDVLEVLRTLPDDSVDLVLTSPPFLALRSYLPAEHPMKDRELGSEPTPGAFVDALLDVVEGCRRVLAPHGSLCIELGDTFADSGGAGGDYGVDGLRAGQPAYDGSSRRRKGSTSPDGATGHYTGRQLRPFGPKTGGGWPMPKSLTLAPELFRISLAYGVNPLTGRTTEPWRIRNVVRHFRPNPPVGSLGDKWRPATSDWAVACTAGKGRYFDIDAVRVPGNPENYRGTKASNGKSDRDTLRQENAGGRPPYDWHPVEEWEDDLEWVHAAGIVAPTHGYPGAHYATFSPRLIRNFIECMSPARVCRVCGEPSRRITRPYADMAERQRVAAEITRCREEVGVSRSAMVSWFPHYKNGRPTEPSVWESGISNGKGAHSGKPSALSALPQTLGWSDCGHGGDWRPGVVLDCFGGSGTTASVSTGHGRNCLLVDLDERNAQLAMDRVGMFLDVSHYSADGSHLPDWLASPQTPAGAPEDALPA